MAAVTSTSTNNTVVGVVHRWIVLLNCFYYQPMGVRPHIKDIFVVPYFLLMMGFKGNISFATTLASHLTFIPLLQYYDIIELTSPPNYLSI